MQPGPLVDLASLIVQLAVGWWPTSVRGQPSQKARGTALVWGLLSRDSPGQLCNVRQRAQLVDEGEATALLHQHRWSRSILLRHKQGYWDVLAAARAADI